MVVRSTAIIKDGEATRGKFQIFDYEVFLKGCQEHQGYEEDMTEDGVYAILGNADLPYALDDFMTRFDVEITEGDVSKISVEALPLFEVPQGVSFVSLQSEHFLALAKKRGEMTILRALGNVERWFSEKKPEISAAAVKFISTLEHVPK